MDLNIRHVQRQFRIIVTAHMASQLERRISGIKHVILFKALYSGTWERQNLLDDLRFICQRLSILEQTICPTPLARRKTPKECARFWMLACVSVALPNCGKKSRLLVNVVSVKNSVAIVTSVRPLFPYRAAATVQIGFRRGKKCQYRINGPFWHDIEKHLTDVP